MSIKAVQNFYDFLEEELGADSSLFQEMDRDSFIQEALLLASNEGFVFSDAEIRKTFSPFGGRGSDDLPEIEKFENPWLWKRLQLGWAPYGYVRD